MEFKRIDNQFTVQVSAKLSGGSATWTVGDLFSYLPSTKIAEKITTKANAEAAIAAGKKLYLVAQGDAITNKTGTPYKCYTISDDVAMSTVEKVVVGYDVDDITNIEGLS